MLEVTVVLTWLWRRGTVFLMRRDRTANVRPTWRAFHIAGRAGKLPTMQMLLREVPRYYAPRYHPSRTGSTERALEVLATANG
jgi:predicted metal-dependent hydrolase